MVHVGAVTSRPLYLGGKQMNFIWNLPLIRRFAGFKEQIMYLFFGVMTTLVYFVTYFPLRLVVEEITATLIANFTAVTFAYITNKIWVFESKTHSFRGLTTEAAKFYSARVFTLVLDVGATFLFITTLALNETAVKAVSQVAIILLNYVLSKLFVFIKNK